MFLAMADREADRVRERAIARNRIIQAIHDDNRGRPSREIVDIEVEYEIKADGSRNIVTSTRCDQRAYLRFHNTTRRVLLVLWRNYEGQLVCYGRIDPHKYMDIDTFATHPFVFQDKDTNERYVVKNKTIFRAEDYHKEYPKRRFVFIITAPVRTLRSEAMLSVALHPKAYHNAMAMHLPRELTMELCSLAKKLDPRRDHRQTLTST